MQVTLKRTTGTFLLVASLTTAAVGGLVGITGTGTAGADDSGAFSAIASASSFRTLFGSPGRFAVDYYVDGGAPVAQAVVNGLGTSTAFASAPYPGETVVAGPGTFAGVTGLPNPGNYPFYVGSSYPSKPDNSAGVVGYDLKVHSEETSSTASAASGGASGDNAVIQGLATSRAARDATGAVNASSQSDSKAVSFGDVLRIANAHATASVVRAPGAEPTRTADFSLTGVSIAGQTVGLSDKGFTLAGTNTALPDSSPLRKALSERGITVTYLHRTDTPEGVISPGLMVSQTSAAPDGGPATVFQVVLGQAVAYVTNSAVAGIPTPAADAGSTTTPDTGSGPLSGAPGGGGDGPAGAIGSAGSGSGGSGSGGSGSGLFGSSGTGRGTGYGASSTSPSAGTDGAAAASDPNTVALGAGGAAERNLVNRVALFGPRRSGSVTGPYLILVAGALAAAAISTLLRLKAVKSA